jgi:uncharacterized protein with HEPN domain
VRVIEVIGEAATRLAPEERPAGFEIPWKEIIGTRNFLAHGYDQLDPDVLLRTLRDDIGPLIAALRDAIDQLTDERDKA